MTTLSPLILLFRFCGNLASDLVYNRVMAKTGLTHPFDYFLFISLFFFFLFFFGQEPASHLDLLDDDFKLGHRRSFLYKPPNTIQIPCNDNALFDFDFDSKGRPPLSLLLHGHDSSQFSTSTYGYLATQSSP